MARTLDITVVVAPSLRGAFEGRRTVSLGLPATAGVGDVVETLLKLYPRTRNLLAGDWRSPAGLFLHLALDERSSHELARGGGGLAAGQKVYIFALSRSPASSRAGREG